MNRAAAAKTTGRKGWPLAGACALPFWLHLGTHPLSLLLALRSQLGMATGSR
jgi:hypothetical protein